MGIPVKAGAAVQRHHSGAAAAGRLPAPGRPWGVDRPQEADRPWGVDMPREAEAVTWVAARSTTKSGQRGLRRRLVVALAKPIESSVVLIPA